MLWSQFQPLPKIGDEEEKKPELASKEEKLDAGDLPQVSSRF